MKELYVWSFGEMTLTGQTRSTWRKTYHSATLPTVNRTWTGLASNLGLRDDRPANDTLRNNNNNNNEIFRWLEKAAFILYSNSTENSPFWEANSSSESQEIPGTLWNSKLHYRGSRDSSFLCRETYWTYPLCLKLFVTERIVTYSSKMNILRWAFCCSVEFRDLTIASIQVSFKIFGGWQATCYIFKPRYVPSDSAALLRHNAHYTSKWFEGNNVHVDLVPNCLLTKAILILCCVF